MAFTAAYRFMLGPNRVHPAVQGRSAIGELPRGTNGFSVQRRMNLPATRRIFGSNWPVFFSVKATLSRGERAAMAKAKIMKKGGCG